MNLAAMIGVRLDGFTIATLPVTTALIVMPTVIANGKFHGGMITPMPIGI